MKFKIKEWTIDELYKKRNRIAFPVYQRTEVWDDKKKSLLIDSIFMGLDIPKLYLQKSQNKDEWDCIDGQQRIKSIVGFFNKDFDWAGKTIDNLSTDERSYFEAYPLTIVEVTEISDEEVRELFIRLQLGIPANVGEKLNAINSNLGKFVKKIAQHLFINNISIPTRRFAKEQVCAQICNNSIYLNKPGDFVNSKYEDLENLYRSNKDFDLNSKEAKGILSTLDCLNSIFSHDATEIKNRASAVSIYLFVEDLMVKGKLDKDKGKKLKKFYLEFLGEIRNQVRLGFDSNNRFLVNYQNNIIQSADSKSAIEERHERIDEAFEYYLKTNNIIGGGKSK